MSLLAESPHTNDANAVHIDLENDPHIQKAHTVNSRGEKGCPSYFKGGVFFKPLSTLVRFEKEVSFYQKLSRKPRNALFPEFYGVCRSKGHGEGAVGQAPRQFMMLENVEAKFRHPCTMDLKLGTQLYDEDATKEEKEKKDSKCPMQKVTGYSVIGMKVFDTTTNTYRTFAKRDRALLNENTVVEQGLLSFFFDGKNFRFDLVRPIKEKLEAVFDWFKTESTYRFYGHSVLVVYEGDAVRVGGRKGVPREEELVQVHLIDFAHWYQNKDGQKDEGSLKGLRSIIAGLERIEAFAGTACALYDIHT